MPAPSSRKVLPIAVAGVLLLAAVAWLAGALDPLLSRRPAAETASAPPPARPAAQEPATPAAPPESAAGTQAGAVLSTHGEWRVVCDTPQDTAAGQCALIQNVVDGERPDVEILVVLLRSADGSAEILRVVVPINVLLRPGLGLYVDDNNIGNVPFHQCLPDGCYAEAILDEPLMGMLRGGEEATFIFFQTPEEGIGIPVDLAGFAEGFDALP